MKSANDPPSEATMLLWSLVLGPLAMGLLAYLLTSCESQEGPAGPPGPQGVQGAPGEAGDPLEVFVYVIEVSGVQRVEAWCQAEDLPVSGACLPEVGNVASIEPSIDEGGALVGFVCESDSAGDNVTTYAVCLTLEPSLE